MPVGGIRPADAPSAPADLVLRNAKVHTGDRRHPSASAVAVLDGRFSAIGDDRTVAPHIGAHTRVVDALGRRVVPGLDDSHLHIIREGLNYFLELRWDGVPTLRMALWMLEQQAARTPPGQWVRVVGGWTAEQFAEKRSPTIAELNAAAPDTPVFVLHLYQSALMNRAGVAATGYDRDTPDPPGGQIVRDRAGNPTGLLLAAPAATLLYATLAKGPVLSPDDQVLSTRYFLRELNRFGITSAIDAAGGFQSFPENYAAIMQLANENRLTVRIAYHLFPQTAGQELDDLRRWIGMVRPGDGDEWLRANGAGENLAWSPADFENFAEPRPELTERAAPDLEAALRLLLENGWGFRLHATYDETIRHDLAVFEKLRAEGVWGDDVTWFFDHAETATQHSLDRIAALGGSMSVQNRMMYQGEVFAARYGDRAAADAPPIRAMFDTGLTVAAGTDATRVSSYNPWLSLMWLTTGRTIGGTALRRPDDLVDLATALEMYTRAGAKLSGEEEVKGSIEIGKYADLSVLSADYFAVPDDQISRIESLLTITGGKIVYSAGEYEGLDDEQLPAIHPEWSPVAAYGGFMKPAGVRQAEAFVEAASESADQKLWRQTHGAAAVTTAHGHDLFGGCF
jgi:predicted amidohydrolase YtcJ